MAYIPDLAEHTDEAITEYLEKMKLRQKVAKESRNYIGGGASGNTKTVRRHNREFKQVYKYYGMSQDDIDSKSERFNDVVRTLAMPTR